MTNDDIKTFADALQHSEGEGKSEKESKVQINKVLRNKSCTTMI